MRQFLWITLFSFFLNIGCQQKSPPPITQRLNLNIPSDPATLDPRKGGDLVSSLFHFLLFQGLVHLDDDGEILPGIAEKFDISEDQTVYTFHLRECFWSDGSLITAWDFEKSWKDILRPEFPSMNAHLLYPIKNAEGVKSGTTSLSEVGIRAINAKTLEITLEAPTSYFLELISFCVFYPVNAEIDHSQPDWDLYAGNSFLCSGPFKLKEWKRNNLIVLEKNPYYCYADNVKLEEIHMSMVNSEMTALQMFEKGEIDILGQPLIPLPTDAIPEISKKETIYVRQVPATTFCTFNVESFPFNNVHIRKAFAYAINRKEIVNNITQLCEEPALGIIPPTLKKHPGKCAFFKDGDIAQARLHFQQGLKELNLKKENFPSIKYYYAHLESNHKIAQALQQQWNEVLGIKIQLESIDRKILIQSLKSGDYQMAQAFWMAQYNDPMNIFERFKYRENVKNYPNWQNETYLDLLNQSCQILSKEARGIVLDQAEALFLDEMPLVPIFHWNSAYIVKPYVKSFGVAPIGNGFFDRVYIDTEEKAKLR